MPDQLVTCLLVLSYASGVLPSTSQDDDLSAIEAKAKHLQVVLAKAKSALSNLHDVMVPDVPVPEDLEQLVDVFHKDDAAIEGFSYMQTECGARSLISVAMAHGAQVDFNAITSTFPTGVDDKAVSLKKFSNSARQYARHFSELIQARDAERKKKKAAAEKASAASESGVA